MADSLKTPSGFHRKLAQVLGNGFFFFFSGHRELWPGLEPLPPAAYLPDGKFIESGLYSLGLKGMNTAMRNGCYISTSKVSFKISPRDLYAECGCDLGSLFHSSHLFQCLSHSDTNHFTKSQ